MQRLPVAPGWLLPAAACSALPLAAHLSVVPMGPSLPSCTPSSFLTSSQTCRGPAGGAQERDILLLHPGNMHVAREQHLVYVSLPKLAAGCPFVYLCFSALGARLPALARRHGCCCSVCDELKLCYQFKQALSEATESPGRSQKKNKARKTCTAPNSRPHSEALLASRG